MKKILVLSAIMFMATTMFGMSNRIHYFEDGSVLLPEVIVFANDSVKQAQHQFNHREKTYVPEYKKEGREFSPRFNHRRPDFKQNFQNQENKKRAYHRKTINTHNQRPENKLKDFRQPK